jgi:phage baseplate assembly protein W
MSFDLKLVNGSFSFGSDGALQRIFNEDKLKQDIVKILLTSQGSSALNPWYGSPLGDRVIGKAMPFNILETEVADAVNFCLTNLMKLQALQLKDGQYLTPNEQLSQILNVKVQRSLYDARQYNIVIDVTTKKGSVIREVFDIQI